MKVEQDILNLVPYSPGKPIDETKREYGLNEVFKLASNENPLGPSPQVMKALEGNIEALYRYPDASCYNLKKALSEFWQISPDQIAVGNGSNELIDLLIRIFCKKGDSVLTTDLGFIAYKICAQAASVKTIEVALNEDLTIQIDKFFETWQRHQSKIIFLPNPNNPTGTYIPFEPIEKLIHQLEGREVLIVLDEAYFEYVNASDYRSCLELAKSNPQVVVLRTFSKAYGLAGLRVGSLVGSKEVVDLMNRVRNPFNVNSLGQIAAEAALSDQNHVEKVVAANQKGLQQIYAGLERMGISYFPSQTNFVLLKLKVDAGTVFQKLLEKGLIARPVKGSGLNNYLRLSIGLENENTKAIEYLEAVLKEMKH